MTIFTAGSIHVTYTLNAVPSPTQKVQQPVLGIIDQELTNDHYDYHNTHSVIGDDVWFKLSEIDLVHGSFCFI